MEGIRLETALQHFLDDLELAGRSPETVASYRSHLRHLTSLPWDGREQLRQALDRGLSMASLLTAYSALSSFGSYCVRQGFLGQNPMQGVPRPKPRQRPHRYLTAEQVKVVWLAAQSSPRKRRETELIVLLLMEGLRAAELCSLRWQDVREDRIIVHGKGGKIRAIPLSPMVKARLIPDEGRIFGFGTVALRKRIARLGKRAGLQIQPHDFRRTWATLGLLAGMDSQHVQTLGGWARSDQVRRYARTMLEEAALNHARSVGLVEKLLE